MIEKLARLPGSKRGRNAAQRACFVLGLALLASVAGPRWDFAANESRMGTPFQFPSGPNGVIQFYSNGVLGGDPLFTYSTTTHRASVPAIVWPDGSVQVSSPPTSIPLDQDFDISDTTGTLNKSTGTISDLNARSLNLFNNTTGFGSMPNTLLFQVANSGYAPESASIWHYAGVGGGSNSGFYLSDYNNLDGTYSTARLWAQGNPSLKVIWNDGLGGPDYRELVVNSTATMLGVPLRLYQYSNTYGDIDYPDGYYAEFRPASGMLSNQQWVLPASDAAGCWQSDGAGNLSIGSCNPFVSGSTAAFTNWNNNGTTTYWVTPPIDATPRIYVLENGTWTATPSITDAARKDHYNVFTTTNDFLDTIYADSIKSRTSSTTAGLTMNSSGFSFNLGHGLDTIGFGNLGSGHFKNYADFNDTNLYAGGIWARDLSASSQANSAFNEIYEETADSTVLSLKQSVKYQELTYPSFRTTSFIWNVVGADTGFLKATRTSSSCGDPDQCDSTYEITVDTPTGSGGAASSFVPIVDQFRVSLASTTAAASTDTVGGTVFLVPVLAGQQISLPDGSGGVFTATTSVLSKSLSGLSADSVYDLYISKNLTLAFSAAWSTWTVRTDALSDGPGFRMVDGGRLIATIRTTAAGTTTRTTGQRYLWNEMNRVKVALLSSTTVDTWAYLGAWHQSNGVASRRIATVSGDASFIDITNNGQVGGNDDWGSVGVGIDRDNGNDANAVTASNGSGAAQPGSVQARLTTTVSAGFHRFDWTERMLGDNALGTAQFFGHNTAQDPDATYSCGMVGWWED